MAEDIERLEAEITALLAMHGEGVNSASRVVNPLLNIWSIANAIDPAAAEPVQDLLTVLPHRALISADELKGVFAKVHVVLEGLSAPVTA